MRPFARGLHDNRRNVSDDLIKAIAASGGVVGTVGFPAFLEPTGQPTLDRFIDDIAYKLKCCSNDVTESLRAASNLADKASGIR